MFDLTRARSSIVSSEACLHSMSSLDSALSIIGADGFKPEDLPEDINSKMWDIIEAKYSLSLQHISALQNFVAGLNDLKSINMFTLTFKSITLERNHSVVRTSSPPILPLLPTPLLQGNLFE